MRCGRLVCWKIFVTIQQRLLCKDVYSSETIGQLIAKLELELIPLALIIALFMPYLAKLGKKLKVRAGKDCRA